MNFRIQIPDSFTCLISFELGWVLIGYISGSNHNPFTAFVVYSILYTLYRITTGFNLIRNKNE